MSIYTVLQVFVTGISVHTSNARTGHEHDQINLKKNIAFILNNVYFTIQCYRLKT